MGPAFANLLEIGGDQYEYIQSVIVDDFLWHKWFRRQTSLLDLLN